MAKDPSREESSGVRRAASSPLSRVERLVVECLDRISAEGRAAMEKILENHPEVADTVRLQVAHLERLGLIGPDSLDGRERTLERFGSFRLLRCIGSGGMGTVYLADQEHLGRRVALKLIRKELLFDAASRSRFRREAQAASQLEHPGICPIHEAGEVDGTPYIAMRYVPGETLAARLARARAEAGPDPASTPTPTASRGPSTRGEVAVVVRLVEELARAAHVAHENGLIHRDLKPGNIMVTPEDKPVILDFGLARLEGGDDATLTQTGDIIGTPAYMAPEQVRGKPANLDRRSDVYALGVILYECLTLKRPFDAATRDRLYQQILVTDPPDPRRLNPRISRDLKVVLETAMEKSPDRRYQTAEALADDLRRIRELLPIQARPASAFTKVQRFARRRPTLAALIALVAVGLPVLGALLVERQYDRQRVEAGRRQQIHERVERHLERGFLYLAEHLTSNNEIGERRTARAVDDFKAALTLRPGSVEAVAGLVLVHKRSGRLTDSLAILERHAELSARYPTFDRIRADVLRLAGRSGEAASVERSLREPGSALGHYLMGLRSMPSCDERDPRVFRPALERFTRAIYMAGRARALYFFGQAHAIEHARDEALAAHCLDALATNWPASPIAWYWRGNLQALRGNTAAAIAAYEKAIEIEPNDMDLHFRLGITLQGAGELDRALAAYERARRLETHGCRSLYNITLVLGEKGDDGRRLPALKQLIEAMPTALRESSLAGRSIDMNDVRDVEYAAYRMYANWQSRSSHVWFNLAESCRGKGLLAEAVAACRRALDLDPGLAAAHRRYGDLLFQLERFDEAAAAFRKAIELEPKDFATHCRLVNACKRQGDRSRVIEALRNAVRCLPENADARFNLGNNLMRAHRPEEAEAAYREALRLRPGFANARSALAAAVGSQGRLDEAVALFREAVRLEPESDLAHANLGLALGKKGDFVGALEPLGRACALRFKGQRPFLPTRERLIDCQKWTINAALNAAAAGFAKGDQTTAGSERETAADYLRRLLGSWRQGLDVGYQSRRDVGRMLGALLRDEKIVDRFEAAERRAWTELRRGIDTLVRRVRD